uniref:TGF_BETA_2 domain-containing protein n=1 Tax=Rhabditophanes sp. KR3021 TaxID=114890 RepID=A0AC35TGD5_9BILA
MFGLLCLLVIAVNCSSKLLPSNPCIGCETETTRHFEFVKDAFVDKIKRNLNLQNESLLTPDEQLYFTEMSSLLFQDDEQQHFRETDKKEVLLFPLTSEGHSEERIIFNFGESIKKINSRLIVVVMKLDDSDNRLLKHTSKFVLYEENEMFEFTVLSKWHIKNDYDKATKEIEFTIDEEWFENKVESNSGIVRLRVDTSESKERNFISRPQLHFKFTMREHQKHKRYLNRLNLCNVDNRKSCCLIKEIISLEEGVFDNIISPKKLDFGYCVGSCDLNKDETVHSEFSKQFYENKNRTNRCCHPIETRGIDVTYVDKNKNLRRTTSPYPLVTRCGCD